jgi:putative flippase GtrA
MIIDYFLLFVFAEILKMEIIFSVIVAFIISANFHFFVNRIYTFELRETQFMPQILRYIFSVVLSLSLTVIIINTLIHNNINLYMSKLIALGAVFILNFIFSNRFVYK